jgi:hypothetical protein
MPVRSWSIWAVRPVRVNASRASQMASADPATMSAHTMTQGSRTGTYQVTITAKNSTGTTTQNLTITIR